MWFTNLFSWLTSGIVFRFHRNKATSSVEEAGPFSDCIKLTTKLFNEVIVPELTAAATDEFPQWRYPRSIVTGDQGLENGSDERDVFQLLQAVEHAVKKAYAQVIGVIEKQTPARSPDNERLLLALAREKLKAAATRDKIIKAIDNYKEDILGHPINIVLAAFLMDLSNQNTVSKVGIYDYSFKNGATRTAKSFLNTFPYDYLAAVYMIGFDCYVRMVAQPPTIEYFRREALPIEEDVFKNRAYSDIANVSKGGCLIVFSFC